MHLEHGDDAAPATVNAYDPAATPLPSSQSVSEATYVAFTSGAERRFSLASRHVAQATKQIAWLLETEQGTSKQRAALGDAVAALGAAVSGLARASGRDSE